MDPHPLVKRGLEYRRGYHFLPLYRYQSDLRLRAIKIDEFQQQLVVRAPHIGSPQRDQHGADYEHLEIGRSHQSQDNGAQ
jgi:hypothetical protein